jgi:hypothetical protein
MKSIFRIVVFLACVGAALAVQPGLNVVEFSEASFPASSGQAPLLSGSTAFIPFGLTFQGSTHLVSASVFTSAGTDALGVAPVQCAAGTACFETNFTGSMTFIFNDGAADSPGATSAKFFWLSGAVAATTSPITAIWRDAQGNVFATDTLAAQPVPASGFISGQFSHTAPAGTTISSVTFTGAPESYGVGRVEFTLEDATDRTVRADNTASADLVASQILCPATAGAAVRVMVCNLGTLAAAASSSSVSAFTDVGGGPAPGGSLSVVATAALASQQCTIVSANAAGCLGGRCEITANVNTGAPSIPETNTTNNRLTLSCAVPPR